MSEEIVCGEISFPVIKQYLGKRKIFDEATGEATGPCDMEIWRYRVRVGNEMMEYYHQEDALLFGMLPDDLKQGAMMDSIGYDSLRSHLINSIAKYNNIQFFPQEYLQTYRWQDLFKAAFKKLFTKKEPIDE
jgi:hypothetical protein